MLFGHSNCLLSQNGNRASPKHSWLQPLPIQGTAEMKQHHELPVLLGLGLTLPVLAAALHKVGLAPKIFLVLLVHFFTKWFWESVGETLARGSRGAVLRKWSNSDLTNRVVLFHKPEFPDVCIPPIIFVSIFNLLNDARWSYFHGFCLWFKITFFLTQAL